MNACGIRLLLDGVSQNSLKGQGDDGISSNQNENFTRHFLSCFMRFIVFWLVMLIVSTVGRVLVNRIAI